MIDKRGFTIVELLIVIVVIAILAAISVVAYGGIQGRAHDNAVQNDLATLKKKMLLLYVDHGVYNTGNLNAANYKATGSAYAVAPAVQYNLLICMFPPDLDHFVIVAQSKTGSRYITSDTTNVRPFTDPWPESQADMCASQGAPNSGVHNYRGYAADDLTGGPWRAWTGVPN